MLILTFSLVSFRFARCAGFVSVLYIVVSGLGPLRTGIDGVVAELSSCREPARSSKFFIERLICFSS